MARIKISINRNVGGPKADARQRCAFLVAEGNGTVPRIKVFGDLNLNLVRAALNEAVHIEIAGRDADFSKRQDL